MAKARKQAAKRKRAAKPAPKRGAPARKPAARKPAARRPAAKRRPAPRAGKPALPMPALLYVATETADVVDVPARTVISIDGTGGPGDGFHQAIGALYGVAYTLKLSRKASRRDFRIGPMEGRWWAEGAASRATLPPIDQWRWRLRIAVPDDVDEHELADVIQAATMKRGGKLEGSAEARRVALERIPAQAMGRVLHVGPYADEPRSFTKIEAALAAAGRRAGLPHLEVYLSDPRRTRPARLKTVLLLETAG